MTGRYLVTAQQLGVLINGSSEAQKKNLAAFIVQTQALYPSRNQPDREAFLLKKLIRESGLLG